MKNTQLTRVRMAGLRGYGAPHVYGYGVGMGIEIPFPRQP